MQVFFMDIPNPQNIPSSLKTSNLQKPSNSSNFYWFFTAALSQKTKKHHLIMKILPLSQQPSKSQTFKFLEFLLDTPPFKPPAQLEPGFVPSPLPSIPPPISSIPPPTLPRLVAQHPSKQPHSLATTQGHNHHSCSCYPNASPATARSVHPTSRPTFLPPATSGR